MDHMTIDKYSFGRIVINGTTYTSDVIIYPDHIDPSWWRKEGHCLHSGDLEGVLSARPDILLVGTGYSGVMRVPEETRNHLESFGIEMRAVRTTEAVTLFNELQAQRKVVAALHLTC
jgi:hypothetical protein